MSKMDSLRALREARYEQEAARGRQAAEGKKPGQARPAARAAEVKVTVVAAPVEAAFCGHPSTDGRTCLREPGHAAKRHRYA